MATPNRVAVQIKPDQVAEGFYLLEDGVLTMTYSDGYPVMLAGDQKVTHVMRPEDNADSIAAVLTKDLRKKLKGELVPGFSDPISYEKVGWA